MAKNITISESKHINEWDWDNNSKMSLDPDKITLGSKIEAYWKCSFYGHSYLMKIYNKKAGKNCPYCFGHKVLEGFNDLANKLPENALYWSDKNPLKSNEVYFNSNKKHFLQCPNCKSEWIQDLKSFNNSKNKCKKCLKNKTSKTDIHNSPPNFTNKFSINNSIEFKNINAKDYKNKYLWSCEQNHEWWATPANIFRGRGCPYCSYKKILKGFNDLESQEPEVAKYFDENANGVKASEVSHKSTSENYKWTSKDCGHSWSSKISRQVSNNYCRICKFGLRNIVEGVNDIFTIYPILKDLFIHELNGDYITYFKSSNKKIKIYCENKKHIIDLNLQGYTGGKIKCNDCLHNKRELIKNLNILKKDTYLNKLEANKIFNVCPDIILEWSNFNQDINNFTIGSKSYALFNCKKCEGIYGAEIKGKFRRDRVFNCKICSGKMIQRGVNDLESYLESERLTPMLNEYAYCNGKEAREIFYNSKNRVIWNCNKCHNFYKRSPHERLIEDKHCQNCNKSVGECELLKFIEEIYEGVIINGALDIIKPYELDIYLPELKMAFEYNGNYWHSDEQLIKRLNMTAFEYHKLKRDKCLDKEIKLAFIWEYDWHEDKKYMKNLIEHFIGSSIINNDLNKLSHVGVR